MKEIDVPETILIVDDVVENLQVLGSILELAGYDTSFAGSGREAIEIAESAPPILILLDVMMPEMDGFETCRRLKASPRTRHIPVIFVTARADQRSALDGFTAGGVDYVGKPINEPELLARVQVHLNLHRARLALINANAAREKFLAIIGHDLRGPLGILTSTLAHWNEHGLTDERRERVIKRMASIAQRLTDLTENLLKWAKMQQDEVSPVVEPFELQKVAIEQAELFRELATTKGVKIVCDVPTLMLAKGDEMMVSTIVRNLLNNALKFTNSGGTVTIRGSIADQARVEVSDTGVGMSEDQLNKLFDIGRISSTTGTAGERGAGMGLILCREFAERCKGTLTIESVIGVGTTVRLSLPTVAP